MWNVIAQVMTTEQVLELVKGISAAAESKNWALLVGLVITLVVAGARALGLLKMVPVSAMKWVASGMAALGSVATSLVTGNTEPLSMVLTALSMGAAAVGGWEMLLKPLLGKVSKLRGNK